MSTVARTVFPRADSRTILKNVKIPTCLKACAGVSNALSTDKCSDSCLCSQFAYNAEFWLALNDCAFDACREHFDGMVSATRYTTEVRDIVVDKCRGVKGGGGKEVKVEVAVDPVPRKPIEANIKDEKNEKEEEEKQPSKTTKENGTSTSSTKASKSTHPDGDDTTISDDDETTTTNESEAESTTNSARLPGVTTLKTPELDTPELSRLLDIGGTYSADESLKPAERPKPKPDGTVFEPESAGTRHGISKKGTLVLLSLALFHTLAGL